MWTLNGASPDFRCLSTDEKPTEGIEENAIALEVDTIDLYYFHDGAWTKSGGEND